jgi:hypothetical protein
VSELCAAAGCVVTWPICNCCSARTADAQRSRSLPPAACCVQIVVKGQVPAALTARRVLIALSTTVIKPACAACVWVVVRAPAAQRSRQAGGTAAAWLR